MSTFNPQHYWEERLGKNFGPAGVGCIGMGRGYNHWLYKVRQRVFLRIISSLNINLMDADVIDIGSGTGFYIESWKKLGVRKIVGTDFTHVSIEHLQRKFPDDRFYQVDIGSNMVTPLGQSSYDIVSAFDVLFHIVDDVRYRKAIQNIYGLLRPGGWFIFSDNFLHSGTERAGHQVSRSLEEITDILIETGFKLVRRTPMFVLMNDPIDQPYRFFRWVWIIFATFVKKMNFFGHIFGTVVYPWEILLTKYLDESPSTEIMICRNQEEIST
jgi:SAM-dependent methyltransferase